MYAKVVIEYGNKKVDKEFTYLIPESLKNNVKVGCRVLVPFNNQTIEGFILAITNTNNTEYELKEIISLVDEEPILNKEMLYLGEKICEKTLCSKISAYQAMLPKALKASHNTKINISYNKYLVLNKEENIIDSYIEKCHYDGQISILKELLKKKKILIKMQSHIIHYHQMKDMNIF